MPTVEVPPLTEHDDPQFLDVSHGVVTEAPHDAKVRCAGGCGAEVGLMELNDNGGLCDPCAESRRIHDQVRKNSEATSLRLAGGPAAPVHPRLRAIEEALGHEAHPLVAAAAAVVQELDSLKRGVPNIDYSLPLSVRLEELRKELRKVGAA